MDIAEIFDQNVSEYEAWYHEYPFVFQSEVEALREMLPAGDQLSGIEVGLGTGKFAQALGIKEGVEPSAKMREIAIKRGIEILDGYAENLPYKDVRFNFVLMNFCIIYFKSLKKPFKEAFRVLKNDGVLLVGFIDRNSPIGKAYELRKLDSDFYRTAKFYSVEKVMFELSEVGFKHFEYRQTLFHPLDEIVSFEPSKPGYGEGSFVVIKAMKKAPLPEVKGNAYRQAFFY